ncbi:glycosyltransferase [Cryomorpha ignava]|uniref:Glycosyltransferase n=1 Tax=Cryomorpha ignava TaxID=101383 RepID=A0A7K3WUY5_9FLAO|nr:glycosyltransferase [Cryomorpha ignava]NEN24861.1 glycosyltransferase [Cryomorpha ignava]
MTDLTVVIVNYNVSYFLEQCLHSVLRASENMDCEVFVVDNDSVDGSVEMVRQKFPWVKLIANKENLGFSKANNQAMKIASGRYVLLLNPDTLVEEDTFVKSVEFMDSHPDAGGLGVKMIDGKGRFLPESKRGLPTPAVAFYKIFGLSALFPKSKVFGQYHLGYLDKDEIHEIPILSGAFILMRKETLDKVGLLDEAFFMYGEDIDLSYRIVLGGYKNYYFPDTRIIHYKGESTKKSSVNYVFVFYRAMLIFANKHFSARLAKTYSFLINMAIYLRASIAIASRFVKKAVVPVLDAIMIFATLLYSKSIYQNYSHIEYHPQMIYYGFAAYTFVWMGSVFLNGGYDKPVNLLRILRGVLIGTIVILASYALLPENLRFSRALILLGTVSTALVYILFRAMLHFLRFDNYRLGRPMQQRVGIVANTAEFTRIRNLLEEAGNPIKSIFQISPQEPSEGNASQADRLQEVTEVYKLDTVIFSGEDVPSHRIISLMASVERKKMDFKIAPPESLYIIGSNSIEKGGDLFIMDIDAVSKPKNKRKKRLLDFLLSFVLLIGLPVLIWGVKNKLGFLTNIFSVLFGQKSWVGYSVAQSTDLQLPNLKKGVLGPLDRLKRIKAPDETAKKLNAVYAREYSTRNDLSIITAGFRNLGRKE